MGQPLTFQGAIARLQDFWAEQGCLVWQPHNVEVGAGTLNPATFLHVLGPEPWNVVYVEPSIRPDDARYGENPNRMARHHQLQVILKPDPGDPQQLFLNSLAAIGVDLGQRDIRFVEDNWESPALGAWGLGWEVWLDGLEITQFTYFQQAGSLDLDPVSVEITYGLDRIVMALQDVQHFKELAWNERVRGADIQAPLEVDTSRYYFEVADVQRLRQLYELCDAEAQCALDADLPYVAHDYVLRCSHLFNILDARGAVGVTERAQFFARMRRLSRAVAERYVASRSSEHHPLLDPSRPWIAGVPEELVRPAGEPAGQPTGARAGKRRGDAPPEPADGGSPLPQSAADLLFEVGTEELPVADIDSGVAALLERLPELLAELRLDHGELYVFGTPRRLAVLVDRLAARQHDLVEEVVGPAASVGYDSSGKPTAAAEGFARGAGIPLDELHTVQRAGQERLAATKRTAGLPAAEVLAAALPSLVSGLTFPRSMRWNASGVAFSRPIRWLVALHGEAIVRAAYAGLEAGRTTRGLRAAGSPPITVSRAADYRDLLREHHVLIDAEERREQVRRQTAALAQEVGGRIPDDPELVAEVANLVEHPLALRGTFDPAYLELPRPVLVTVLRKHQRTFPVAAADGSLAPYFVAVANGRDFDLDAVRHGNEAVVGARFADAAYFWKRDTSRPLSEFTPELAKLTHQSELGSMLDKVGRLVELVPKLGAMLGLAPTDLRHATRAAELAKSDLATEMVVDFTSLQGAMGCEYALRSGEPAAVAQAIYEQYLPRGAGDAMPGSPAGTVLALADRLDSLTGLFAVGMKPSGTADPYALRRAALGLVTILIDGDWHLDLARAVRAAAEGLPKPAPEEAQEEVLEFIRRRLEVRLREVGHAADVVSAVLAVQSRDPALAADLAGTLAAHVARPDWLDTLHAYARCARIVRGSAEAAASRPEPSLFREAAEGALHDATEGAVSRLPDADLGAVLEALAALAPTINDYFDRVLVMCEDTDLRRNRLATVRRIAELPAGLADLSLLEGF